MNRIFISATLGLAVASPFVLSAQDFIDGANRWSFGPSFNLNIKADFHNNGSFLNPANPGPAIGGVNHTYNDGYVHVDSSGDAGGLTWNWGYHNSSQVVGDTLQFHAVQAENSSSVNDPQYGLDLVYQRYIGHLPYVKSGSWGFEAGFGYTDLDLRDNNNGNVHITTDTFQLNGVLPPGAGYNGTFSGPGALLGDTPTRTLESAMISGNQKLSGSLFKIRLGPFAEWNFFSKFSLQASAGITLAPTMVDYDYSESVTLASGTFASSGHSSKSKLLYGPYAGLTARYEFNQHWGIFLGAQFQNLTSLTESSGSNSAHLDLGATVDLTGGISWRF
jgi:hypothetical protein